MYGDRRHRARCEAERGFSIVELIVVMVILAILASIAAYAKTSGQRAGVQRQLRTAARSYHEALQQYADDNGGQVPAVGNARGWPSIKPEQGPVDRMQATFDARYMKQAPEAVADGRICLRVGSTSCSTTGQIAVTITAAPPSWRVDATYDGEAVCSLASSAVIDPKDRC